MWKKISYEFEDLSWEPLLAASAEFADCEGTLFLLKY